jgi:DNA-binding CsgD family transcriptional regulator
MFSFQSGGSEFDQIQFDHSTMSQLLVALMDRIECGVIACGPSGELYHANVAARRELSDARVLCLAQGRVGCCGECRDTWIAGLQGAAVRKRSSLVSLSEGGERLMVALMPVRVGTSDTLAAVALMGRRTVCSPLGLEMLSNSHGLTSAERRVLRALIHNSTAREIAESHGVKVATVRTQIQAVRDKLGVRSIEALLLRAAEVPPITARH